MNQGVCEGNLIVLGEISMHYHIDYSNNLLYTGGKNQGSFFTCIWREKELAARPSSGSRGRISDTELHERLKSALRNIQFEE